MLVEARLLVGTKERADALTGGRHDRLMTCTTLILCEALIAKRLMLCAPLGHDLLDGCGLRGVEVQVLLHARDTLCRVASTRAAVVTTATMLAMTSSGRRCVLRRGEQGRAQGKRCDSEEHGDAIVGAHGDFSF